MKLVLEKDWNDNPKGRELEVLEPGETIRPGAVDRVRADALLRQELARIEPGAEQREAVANIVRHLRGLAENRQEVTETPSDELSDRPATGHRPSRGRSRRRSSDG